MNGFERAVSSFKEGFSCSQALLSIYGTQLGLNREMALKVSGAFGGGMGRMGETCGAVTGAFMIIGLKYGKTRIKDEQTKEKKLVTTLCPKFVQDAAEIIEQILGVAGVV